MPMECKQPENVLLLMKVSFVNMFIYQRHYTSHYSFFISVKQILNYVRSLGPHTWVKLTLNGIFVSVKQILSYVRSLGPHTWVKLTLNGIFISVKQILSYVRSLKPHT